MKTITRTFKHNWTLLLALAALILLPFIIQWITGDPATARRGESVFWQGIMIEVYILGILAMSYNLIFGFTGVISFGHALFFGIGGYSLAIFTEKLSNGAAWGLPVGLLAGLLIAAVVGLGVGLVSLRLRGVYFALFTLAIAEMFFIYFSRFAFTSAEDGFAIGAVPDWLNPTRNRLIYYYITLALMSLTFVFIRRLISSPVGAVLVAIRENEERARAIGYNTLNYKLYAITVSSLLAALAGALHVLFNKKVGPEVLGLTYTVDPLLGTIIGGLGTFVGPVLGMGGIHLSDRLLRDTVLEIGTYTLDIGASWNVILGSAFILVVIVFPRGIVGTFRRQRTRP
ncbi:MAG: branched-chain amino acid ABC transporter permease [Chloroflexota bacterium]